METKTCSMCNIKKIINNFQKVYKEYKVCNSERSPKPYFENEDEVSNRRKIYYEKIEINFTETKLQIFKL